MLYHIAYCDDERTAGQTFAQQIADAFARQKLRASVTFFSSPHALIDYLEAGNRFDVLFLDIDMPERNGILLGRQLQEKNLAAPIVFLSNRDELVYQALQVRPIRFLRKSCFSAEIDETVAALQKLFTETSAEIVVFQNGKETYQLPVLGILYLEIINQTLTVWMKDTSVSLRYPLNQAEQLLLPHGFLRIHNTIS